MLCIASFIVFIFLGIFSAYYRSLAAKAWYCVGKRVTFQPCDINFSEEIKGKLIGKYVISHPRFARFMSKWIDFFAFIFVVVSIWSLFSVMITGLNLFVYDTCDPVAPESCSLGGEACGISTDTLDMVTAYQAGKIGEWMAAPFVTFADTVSRVPDRFRAWNAEEFAATTKTYYAGFDEKKTTVLEVMDPGCIFCKKMFQNAKSAGVETSHNFTYLLYPIPAIGSGTKFPHSPLVASYVEALKSEPTMDTKGYDWKLLEYIFTAKTQDGKDVQAYINTLTSTEDAQMYIHSLLKEFGLSEERIDMVAVRAASPQVQGALFQQKKIVEDKLRTKKIPTFLFEGRRYDRVVGADQLK